MGLYQDRVGKNDDTNNDSYFAQPGVLEVKQAGETVSSVLNFVGWITILIGFAVGFFAVSDTSLTNSLGGLSVLVSIILSSPIIVSGILLLAGGSIVKSTAETALNTKKMLDIMQQ